MVEQLDLSTRMAYCRAAADLKYYTRVHDVIEINILQDDDNGDGTAGDETASSSSSPRLGFDGGMHAASHALLSVLPLRMMCAASDLGTRCAAAAVIGSGSGSGAPGDGGDRAPGVLLLYDKHLSGIGLAA